jgi:hypothetical protein
MLPGMSGLVSTVTTIQARFDRGVLYGVVMVDVVGAIELRPHAMWMRKAWNGRGVSRRPIRSAAGRTVKFPQARRVGSK